MEDPVAEVVELCLEPEAKDPAGDTLRDMMRLERGKRDVVITDPRVCGKTYSLWTNSHCKMPHKHTRTP